MDSRLRVDLGDLRGWAGQVGRAGEDCTGLATYVGTYAPDGDFGRILELVTDGYETFASQARTALAVDGARLEQAGAALHASATAYARGDAHVARTLGSHGALPDRARPGAGFRDCRELAAPPVADAPRLPEVTLGWTFDKACQVIAWVGGPDLRRDITDWLAGDLAKASLQADAWERAAAAVGGVRDDLGHGLGVVARSWEGQAARSSAVYVGCWLGALDTQRDAMAQVAAFLRDLVTQAVAVAQVVVDCVLEIISIVMAVASGSVLPGWAEIRLVRDAEEAVALALRARGVLTAFWRYVRCVRDSLVLAGDCFTAESLPQAPAAA